MPPRRDQTLGVIPLFTQPVDFNLMCIIILLTRSFKAKSGNPLLPSTGAIIFQQLLISCFRSLSFPEQSWTAVKYCRLTPADGYMEFDLTVTISIVGLE